MTSPAHDLSGRRGRRRGVAVTAAVVLLVGIAILATVLLRLLPSLSNPFGTETVDRSGPVLLTRLTDLARFQAATGSFQVIVDVEKDVKNVPSALAGQRTLFVANGDVDAYVDFATIDQDAVTVSADGKRVDIVLPPAQLSDARVDTEQSRVYSRDRGIFDRLGGVFSDNPTSERELYLSAENKFEEAAEASELRQRAEANTRTMLTGLLGGGLGYTEVNIEFSPDARP